MSVSKEDGGLPQTTGEDHDEGILPQENPTQGWRRFFRQPKSKALRQISEHDASAEEREGDVVNLPEKWSMGVLNDKLTDEVPGSVLLLSKIKRNEPLGLEHVPASTSASSLPSPFPPELRPPSSHSAPTSEEVKKTSNGQIILDPQPDDSLNDPLNWPSLRRDAALLSLGFYCMVGGGMTPILAAGFDNVAAAYDVTIPQVALTTGLYMLGLGVGSVIASPTAIIFGKRPVYLVGIILFMISAVWCALSPNYASLITARVFMGLAVSPVECLPSATIAEIFFLHERAYRLGVYTLLLLSGKNLVPLVSAVIIQSLGWRWVFWIVAFVVGFCFALVFLFIPETFWDRTPRAHKTRKAPFAINIPHLFHHGVHGAHGSRSQSSLRHHRADHGNQIEDERPALGPRPGTDSETIAQRRQLMKGHPHVGFIEPVQVLEDELTEPRPKHSEGPLTNRIGESESKSAVQVEDISPPLAITPIRTNAEPIRPLGEPVTTAPGEKSPAGSGPIRYTQHLQTQPPKNFLQTLRPWNGRLRHDKWLKVAFRPFVLFAYPAILWSTLVYSLSIGWLIILSETVSAIFRNKATYNFSALGTGFIYISPFIGGVLGTAVAGKLSDVIVRFMSRRNGGLYEPEFRLVMAIPVTLATCIGLMGFGWSAQEKDRWIVPTVFFGIISFGCSLGSTTAITFAVDSYRQYAGEALVTLNFSKNIFHGLVFSLFFNRWLQADGSKDVFLALGGIQLACLMTTIPMFIFGKRARMWTVRKKFMERF